MSTHLKIAANLSLPLDAATQTFAFIARKGAGKTYTAGKLVELLLDAGVQVVVLDTVGNWYGLRLGADGKASGFDIPVLGGLRGDIPLEAAGGALIADIVVDTGRSLVLDASQFSLGDRKRFAVTFGERLWQRKKGESHPAPLHLVIEESQLIVPQFTGRGGDEGRMVGIYEEIIRLGRNYGIGCSMITQRPQSVNKEVLNQTECLFVGQVNGAQERDALKKWITHQGMDVHLVDELPSLKVGVFYVWSPQWLDLLQKVTILPKKTLDASATPKVGDKRMQRDLKPLDLNDLQDRLQATIAKAKADDPRELRKQIADLKRQIVPAGTKSPETIRTVEKPVVKDAQLARIDKQIAALDKAVSRATAALSRPAAAIQEQINQLAGAVKTVRQPAPPMTAHARASAAMVETLASRPIAQNRPVNGVRPPSRMQASGAGDITGPELKILTALAELEALGLHPADKQQLGLNVRSGGFSEPLGRLMAAGYTVAPTAGKVAITDGGRAAVGPVSPPADAEEMQARILSKLTGPEQRILRVILGFYPQPVSKDQIAAACDPPYTNIRSGGFSEPLGRLNTLGIVQTSGGQVVASPAMFLE